MINETQRINLLLDVYEILLTEKQQAIMDMHYKEDYSLAEIAELLNVSRSAVNDHIKRSTILLNDYEKKLHLVENLTKRKQIYDKIRMLGNSDIRKLVDELEEHE